jgi:hypothetical protein
MLYGILDDIIFVDSSPNLVLIENLVQMPILASKPGVLHVNFVFAGLIRLMWSGHDSGLNLYVTNSLVSSVVTAKKLSKLPILA